MNAHLFGFDMNGMFGRIYGTHAKDVIPSGPLAYYQGASVFGMIPLLHLLKKEFHAALSIHGQCTHIVLVFDSMQKNFRHDIDPSYKGNRKPKTQAWLDHETHMIDFFSALGFPCIRANGVESDDVLGTLSTTLSAKKIKTTLFARDKDILSLANEHTDIYVGTSKTLMRQADVEAKFGIPVSRLLDYLAITGDSVDHVSGIHGMGAKAAVKVLNLMDLKSFLADPSILTELGISKAQSIIEWIKNNGERIETIQRLIQLKKDVQLGINMNQLIMKEPQLHQNTLMAQMVKERGIKFSLMDQR